MMTVNVIFIVRLNSFFRFVLDINECLTTQCHRHALCTNSNGSFTCTCNDGFLMDGSKCGGTAYPRDSKKFLNELTAVTIN